MKIYSIVVCVFAVGLLGCQMTERAAVRKLGRVQQQHPQLFQSDSTATATADTTYLPDTVLVEVEIGGERAELELVLHLGELSDSIEVLEGRLRLQAKVLQDWQRGETVVNVQGECLPDTQRVEVPVVRERVVVKYERLPCTVTATDRGLPWWALLVGGLLVGALSYFFGLKKSAVENTVGELLRKKK